MIIYTPLTLLRNISAFLIVALIFTNIVQYGVLAQWLPLGLASLTVLFASIATVLVVAGRVQREAVIPIIVWSYCFVSLVSIRQLSAGASSGNFREVGLVLMFVILLVASVIIFAEESAVRVGLMTVVGATLFSVLLNVYEFMNPGIFSTVPGRSAGLYENPNTSGAVLVMGMVLGTRAVPPRYRLLFQALVGIGVLSTVSRGGLFGWLCAVVLLQFSYVSRKNAAQAVSLLLVSVWVIYLSPLWSIIGTRLSTSNLYSSDLFGRLELTDRENIASDARADLLSAAWERYLEHPLFGQGGGIPLFGDGPFPQGPHNMFLLLLIQYGVLGGVLMVALIVLLLRSGVKRSDMVLASFAATICVQAFFTHNMFTQYPFSVGIALAAAIPLLHKIPGSVSSWNESATQGPPRPKRVKHCLAMEM